MRSFFGTTISGIRLGRLEIYRIKIYTKIQGVTWKDRFSEAGVIKGACGCIILDAVFIGFTWLGPGYKCPGGTDD